MRVSSFVFRVSYFEFRASAGFVDGEGAVAGF
jgi:hypothetical protein